MNETVKRKAFIKIAALTLSAAVSFGGSVFASSAKDYTGDIKDTKSDLSETESKLSEIQRRIKERQDYLTDLANSLAGIESEKLSQMNDKEYLINELLNIKENIENFDNEIAEMQKEHDDAEELLLDRTRVMYQSSTDFELIQMFFTSKNIFDFIEKINIYRKMIAEDRELLSKIKQQEAVLEEKKAQEERLFSDKETILAEIEAAIRDLESDQEFITGNYENLTALVQNLEKEKEQYELERDEITDKLNELEKLQREAEEAARRAEEERKRKEEEAKKAAAAEKARLEAEAKKAAEAAEKAKQDAANAQKEIDQTLKDVNSSQSRSPESAGFCWPLESYIKFTDYYGYRNHPIAHVWMLHAGTDIAASKGTKIYAAQSGKVSMAADNGAYGLTVIIDHGNGLQSVYAHCSKLLVSKGQQVTKGQTIALVGMTGGATGCHLHFEVRLDGKPVDSLPYLKGLY